MNAKIINLSKLIFDRQHNKQKPYILLLGAGASRESKCPSWWQLCKKYCEEHSVAVTDNDYIKVFQKQKMGRIDVYSTFAEKLGNKKPSIGYYHLANLIEKGVFDLILTTNFDNLLEKALAEVMPIDNIKVLIKGELGDDYIADFIEKGASKIKIIKLHGDLQSNVLFYKNEDTYKFSDKLKNILASRIEGGSIIVGHSMEDEDLHDIYKSEHGYNIFVNLKTPTIDQKKLLKIDTDNQVINDKITVKIYENGKEIEKEECLGNFDIFFTELNLEFQRNVIEQPEQKQKRKEVEKIILEEAEKGVSYINYNQLEIMVNNFWNTIKGAYDSIMPDVIVFINDPTAPGGMEIKRRMNSLIASYNEKNSKKIFVETVNIEGEKTRYDNRKVTSLKPTFKFDINIKEHRNILLLDAVSFSGKTLKIAIQKYKEWFTDYTIRGGIMMVDDQLIEKIKDDDDIKNIIFQETTTRYEIFFPWGVTQATSDESTRKVQGSDYNPSINIQKRAWGTVAVLAQQENCSVRILTIEADQKLSFQRHLVRDEFFISLDDNIGLEICTETLDDLPDNTDINDIKEIKSLVLEKGDYVMIPKGIWHRMKASKDRARLLEIGYGVYDQKRDLEKRDDAYRRAKLDDSK